MPTGKPFEMKATELLTVCIQHEMDHLSRLAQMRVRSKMIKRHRDAARALRALLHA